MSFSNIQNATVKLQIDNNNLSSVSCPLVTQIPPATLRAVFASSLSLLLKVTSRLPAARSLYSQQLVTTHTRAEAQILPGSSSLAHPSRGQRLACNNNKISNERVKKTSGQEDKTATLSQFV